MAILKVVAMYFSLHCMCQVMQKVSPVEFTSCIVMNHAYKVFWCSVQCEACSVQFAVCSVQCSVCIVQFFLCSGQCLVCSVQCAVQNWKKWQTALTQFSEYFRICRFWPQKHGKIKWIFQMSPEQQKLKKIVLWGHKAVKIKKRSIQLISTEYVSVPQ